MGKRGSGAEQGEAEEVGEGGMAVPAGGGRQPGKGEEPEGGRGLKRARRKSPSPLEMPSGAAEIQNGRRLSSGNLSAACEQVDGKVQFHNTADADLRGYDRNSLPEGEISVARWRLPCFRQLVPGLREGRPAHNGCRIQIPPDAPKLTLRRQRRVSPAIRPPPPAAHRLPQGTVPPN